MHSVTNLGNRAIQTAIHRTGLAERSHATMEETSGFERTASFFRTSTAEDYMSTSRVFRTALSSTRET